MTLSLMYQSQALFPKVYILGEVTRPQKLNITETPISLTDALGLVNGLNTNTSSASEVYVIRQPENGNPQNISGKSQHTCFTYPGR